MGKFNTIRHRKEMPRWLTDATLLWSIWQAFLQHFAEGITALALNVEEYTVPNVSSPLSG